LQGRSPDVTPARAFAILITGGIYFSCCLFYAGRQLIATQPDRGSGNNDNDRECGHRSKANCANARPPLPTRRTPRIDEE
jgi:hypothetical protein